MTMDSMPGHLEDEILSALLDGDAAGADPGAEASAHVRACARCAGRQAELGAARAALAAVPAEPLDELSRRRLVAGALQAADGTPARIAAGASVRTGRARWASRHPALIGSAAAVLLAVLVGVPFVVGDGGGSGGDSTLSAQAPLREGAGSFLGDLGDLSDHDRLRLRLTGGAVSETYGSPPMEPGPSPAAGGGFATPAAPAPAPASGGLASAENTPGSTPGAARPNTGTGIRSAAPTAKSAAPGADSIAAAEQATTADQAADRDRADTDACVRALLDGPARGGRLIASGTGTFEGRPAIVAAFDLSGGTVAFVADRSGCAVLDRFSV